MMKFAAVAVAVVALAGSAVAQTTVTVSRACFVAQGNIFESCLPIWAESESPPAVYTALVASGQLGDASDFGYATAAAEFGIVLKVDDTLSADAPCNFQEICEFDK